MTRLRSNRHSSWRMVHVAKHETTACYATQDAVEKKPLRWSLYANKFYHCTSGVILVEGVPGIRPNKMVDAAKLDIHSL